LAKFVATQFAISINGVALSGNIAAATITETAEEVEITAFGNSHRQRVSGLRDASVSLDWHQDYGAGSVHATLNPLVGSYATVTIVPTAGSVSLPQTRACRLCSFVTEYTRFLAPLATSAPSPPRSPSELVSCLTQPRKF
jgi:hypothetical protein